MNLQKALDFGEPKEAQRPLRRRVHRVLLDPLRDGAYLFKTKSFTRRGVRSYRLRVNPESGFVSCSCRDFQFRHSKYRPTYNSGPVCKHLARAIRTVRGLVRRQEISRAA